MIDLLYIDREELDRDPTRGCVRRMLSHPILVMIAFEGGGARDSVFLSPAVYLVETLTPLPPNFVMVTLLF